MYFACASPTLPLKFWRQVRKTASKSMTVQNLMLALSKKGYEIKMPGESKKARCLMERNMKIRSFISKTVLNLP